VASFDPANVARYQYWGKYWNCMHWYALLIMLCHSYAIVRLSCDEHSSSLEVSDDMLRDSATRDCAGALPRERGGGGHWLTDHSHPVIVKTPACMIASPYFDCIRHYHSTTSVAQSAITRQIRGFWVRPDSLLLIKRNLHSSQMECSWRLIQHSRCGAA
jgi:hypothetical protein